MNERYQQFSHWLRHTFGQLVLKEEQNYLQSLWDKIIGDYLLILGDHIQGRLAEKCNIKKRWIVSPNDKFVGGSHLVFANYEELPFASNCVDIVLLPHTLEFAEDPYQVLREVEIIMRPEGQLIVIGFNPWGYYGLRRLLSLRKRAPWSGEFRSASRIKEWLKVLNFDVIKKEHIFCHPLIAKRGGVLEKCIKTYLPILCGIYVIVAKKKVFGVTPSALKWKKVTEVIQKGIAEPATNEIHSD